MLYHQQFSTCYKAVRINKLFENTSAIKVTTKKKMDNFSMNCGSHHMLTTKSTLYAVRKDDRDTKEDVGKSRRKHSTYSGLTKGTSWQNIKPVTLAIVKLC